MRLPSVRGVSFLNRIELVGLLPLKTLYWRELLYLLFAFARSLQFRNHLFHCLALHQGLCLGKKIGKQNPVMVT